MNTREIFLETLDFNTNIRTLDWEFGYWGGTIKRWYNEGLPKKHGLSKEVTYGEGICGPGLHWPMPSFADEILLDKDVRNYFKFDENLTTFPFDHWMYPKFEKELKEFIVDYGRTIRSLDDDEVLMLKVKLTRCKGCSIPSNIDVSLKAGVLKDYDQQKINRDKALGSIEIKKYEQ